jgi:hypothetical protein
MSNIIYVCFSCIIKTHMNVLQLARTTDEERNKIIDDNLAIYEKSGIQKDIMSNSLNFICRTHYNYKMMTKPEFLYMLDLYYGITDKDRRDAFSNYVNKMLTIPDEEEEEEEEEEE